MFPISITSTPLTTRTADAVFGNIIASSYGDDISFSVVNSIQSLTICIVLSNQLK